MPNWSVQGLWQSVARPTTCTCKWGNMASSASRKQLKYTVNSCKSFSSEIIWDLSQQESTHTCQDSRYFATRGLHLPIWIELPWLALFDGCKEGRLSSAGDGCRCCSLWKLKAFFRVLGGTDHLSIKCMTKDVYAQLLTMSLMSLQNSMPGSHWAKRVATFDLGDLGCRGDCPVLPNKIYPLINSK